MRRAALGCRRCASWWSPTVAATTPPRWPGPQGPRWSRSAFTMRVRPGPAGSGSSRRPAGCRRSSCGSRPPTPTAGCHRTGSPASCSTGPMAGTPSSARSWSMTGRPTASRPPPTSPGTTARRVMSIHMCTAPTSAYPMPPTAGSAASGRLALAEDHALVAALTRCGLRIARPGDLPVVTSARRDPRAAGGFGELLCSLEVPSGEAARLNRPYRAHISPARGANPVGPGSWRSVATSCHTAEVLDERHAASPDSRAGNDPGGRDGPVRKPRGPTA